MNSKNIILIAVITSILTTAIIIGGGYGLYSFERYQAKRLAPVATSTAANVTADESAVVAAVKKANPAVVSIIISKNEPVYTRNTNPNSQTDPSDPFNFFNNFFDNQTPQYVQNGTALKEIGGGSGFLVSSDGLVVTNKHVVDDSGAIYTVYTNDGDKHTAKVVATDPLEDIALLRIDGKNYPSLTFGDSKNLELGQTVIAIGNALAEFRNTVSVGVISGLSRSITAGDLSNGGSEELDEVIQTDAAINPGNSGGPLLDLYGDVIGVNVAVAEGSQNVGFALPGYVVKSAVDSVKATGAIVHPFLGVHYEPVTDAIEKDKKLSVDYGDLVTNTADTSVPAVVAGSPAEKAGIVDGDVILSFDGIKLTSDQKLSALVLEKNVGDVVSLVILHAGTQKTIKVTLAKYNDSTK